MRIDILTVFPEMFRGPFDESIVKRAREKGLVDIRIYDLRGYSRNKHRKVDDYPYGGGPGMVLRPEPLFEALESVLNQGEPHVILLTPAGKRYDQEMAKRLAQERHLVLICGHYKGVDERVGERFADEQISIGDYVLTGGELPAMVLVDSIVRLLPGAIGDQDSAEGDSFQHGLLDHPHYTRPEVYRGMRVPEVLLSGNHGRVRQWRRQESLRRTLHHRQDLLAKAELTEEDRKLLKELEEEENRKGRV